MIGFFKTLSKFEKLWLMIFSTVILATTICFSATSTGNIVLNWVVSPISALTGVVCVVLCAKGHISNWTWGLINSITYGAVAWAAGYYGDFMLNIFFFAPTQFFIYFAWKKHIDTAGLAVKKRLNWKSIAISVLTGAAIIYLLTTTLVHVDGWFMNALKRNVSIYQNLEHMFGWKYLGPFLDASTVVLQIFAELFLIFRFAEQWPLWFATNVASIVIWSAVIITDPKSYSYSRFLVQPPNYFLSKNTVELGLYAFIL